MISLEERGVNHQFKRAVNMTGNETEDVKIEMIRLAFRYLARYKVENVTIVFSAILADIKRCLHNRIQL